MKIIVISAHPDDEVLGCGGTLSKHLSNKDEIAWLIVTSIFEHQGFSKERIAERQREIEVIKKSLNIEKIYQLDFPTMTLSDEKLGEMITQIAEIFKSYEPQIIYVMNRSDAHSDHWITFKAVMACTKSFRHPYVQRVLMYECISETEFSPALHENAFIPNYFVDISNFMDQKIDLMKIYKSEIGVHPFPRSEKNIRALGTFRGAMAGVEYAESFQILKWIEK